MFNLAHISQPKFQPLPAVFLNRKSWLDRPEASWLRWLTPIPIYKLPWYETARIRIATCPWKGCNTYTSVFRVNPDGTPGEPIVGWPGYSNEGPSVAEYWWDDAPWCWFTTSILNSTAGSNQTYTSSSTWVNANNYIETIGAGGGGGAASNSLANSRAAAGGGGGGYSKHTNFTFATPGTTTATYQLGLGGLGQTVPVTVSANGVDGGDTWFNGSTYASCTVGAKGGGGGQGTLITDAVQGAGGSSASGTGNSTKFSGGNGTGFTGQDIGASGGGGAAGPNGAGASSPTPNSGGNVMGTNGGQGDNGVGGAGGAGASNASPGSNGTPGTEFDASNGCGGGGGGCGYNSAAVTVSGGTGALYGAGGGAAASRTSGSSAVSGDGSKGLIVLTWFGGLHRMFMVL